jgi:hypothetical protein
MRKKVSKEESMKQKPKAEKSERKAPEEAEKKQSSLIEMARQRSKAAASVNGDVEPSFRQIHFHLAKPDSQEFFWVHPDKNWRIDSLRIIEDRATTRNPVFVLHPEFDPPSEIARWVKEVTLVTCITRSRIVSLWPAKHDTESTADVIREGIENPPRCVRSGCRGIKSTC